MTSSPSYGLLASTYFGRQELGTNLEDIARFVAKYARDAGDLGRRSARRADLTAAAKAAARLQAALRKIDRPTQAEAIRARLAALDGHHAPDPGAGPLAARQTDDDRTEAGGQVQGIIAHRIPEILGALERMHGTLDRLAEGLAALAEATPVSPKGGRPKRSDPLQAGLEALSSLWLRVENGPVTMSFKQGGFGALAVALLAAPHGPFETRTVEGAVVDFVAELPGSSARTADPS